MQCLSCSECPTGSSGEGGGYLGELRQGQMVPEVDSVVFGTADEQQVIMKFYPRDLLFAMVPGIVTSVWKESIDFLRT